MEDVDDVDDCSYRLRMLIWQLAMKKVSMTAGSSDDPMSLTYPAHVAKDSMAFLSRVSLDSIIAHGPGMVGGSLWLVEKNELMSPAGAQDLRDC
jgi:hypothetical protein